MCSPNQQVLHQQQQDKQMTTRPRRAVTLQRHTTLPGPLRSLPIAKVKSSSSSSSRKNNSTLLQKNNPYVGWFRHAPPRHHRVPNNNNNNKNCFLLKPRKQQMMVVLQHHHHSRQWYQERGLLRGGTTFNKAPQDALLLSDDDDDDTDSGETLDDEFTYVDDDDASIRSDTRLDLLYVDPQERLDYNITQMDIVRMNRVASRHLDVESIANLPVVTYQGPKKKQESSSNSNNNNKAFSWMLVHSDSETSDDDTNDATQDDDADTTAPMCIICCETFVQGDRLRVLPCSHKFHTGCIDRWLSGSHSSFDCFTAGCPTCKKSIPTQSYFRVGDALASHSFVA